MEIVILGTGGLAKEIYGMLYDMKIGVAGFVAKDRVGGYFMELPILGDDDWLRQQKGLGVVIAVGTPALRHTIHNNLKDYPLTFPSFVHPGAKVYKYVTWHGGCIIQPGGVVQTNVKIGFGTYINMGVTIGHDTVIGDYCVINHNAGISGNVTIGDNVLVGAGATIIENHRIGNSSTIGAGAVLTKDVPPNEIWIGVPAKPLVKQPQPNGNMYTIESA